jgi:hypothetical protein
MYVCEECGEKYRGNFGKCANCGGKIVVAPPRLTLKQRFAANAIKAKVAPQKTAQKIKRRKKDLFIFFIVAGIILSIFWATKGTPPASTPPNNIVTSEVLSVKHSGDITVLRHSALIAIDDGAYADLGKFSASNDKEALTRMITGGRLVLVGVGAKITILKVNGESSYVEVTDGPTAGAKGWLLNSLMR